MKLVPTALIKTIRRRLRRIVLPPMGCPALGGRASFSVGYVIPVSQEMHNAMRRLQVRLLREFGTLLQIEENPHITLKQAFPIAALEPFEHYLDRLAGDLEPFEVEVRDIGVFDEGILFLDVVKSDPLCALRRRIVHDLSKDLGVNPAPIEDERYRFHATIAHGLRPPHFERARRASKSATGDRLEFQFTCDTLGLLLHTGCEWMMYRHSKMTRPR